MQEFERNVQAITQGEPAALPQVTRTACSEFPHFEIIIQCTASQNDTAITISLTDSESQAERAVLMIDGNLPDNSATKEQLLEILEELRSGYNTAAALGALEHIACESNLKVSAFYPNHQKDFVSYLIPDRIDIPRYNAMPYLTSDQLLPSEHLAKHADSNLLNARDTRTLLRRSILLESEPGVEELNRIIPHPKALVFFDFNHMAAADKSGMQDAIENCLIGVKIMSDCCFGKEIAHEVLSLGGDEFALIVSLENQELALKRVAAFFDSLNRLAEYNIYPHRRDLNWSPKIGKRLQAEKLAKMKSACRAVRDCFMKTLAPGEHFTSAQYAEWLGQQLNKPIQVSSPEAIAKSSFDLAATWLSNSDHRLPPAPQILSVTYSQPVALSPQAGIAEWRAALRLAQTDVTDRKRSGHPAGTELVIIDSPTNERRRADNQALQSISDTIHALKRSSDLYAAASRSDVQKSHFLQTLALRETQHGLTSHIYLGERVLNSYSMRDLTFEQIGFLDSPQEITVLRVDLPHFGAINSAIGYRRADEALREITSSFLGALPPCLCVRLGGGTLAFIIKGELAPYTKSGNLLQGVANYARRRISHLTRDERLAVELAERAELERWEKQILGKSQPENPSEEFLHASAAGNPLELRFETFKITAAPRENILGALQKFG